jgi:hypothetical protein
MRNNDYHYVTYACSWDDIEHMHGEREDFEEWNQRITDNLAPKEDDHLPQQDTIITGPLPLIHQEHSYGL